MCAIVKGGWCNANLQQLVLGGNEQQGQEAHKHNFILQLVQRSQQSICFLVHQLGRWKRGGRRGRRQMSLRCYRDIAGSGHACVTKQTITQCSSLCKPRSNMTDSSKNATMIIVMRTAEVSSKLSLLPLDAAMVSWCSLQCSSWGTKRHTAQHHNNKWAAELTQGPVHCLCLLLSHPTLHGHDNNIMIR